MSNLSFYQKIKRLLPWERTGRKLNKYEARIAFNQKLMVGVFAVALLVNFFLPMYKNDSLGITSFLQWLEVIFLCAGLLFGIGSIQGQKVPILPCGILRLVQAGLYFKFDKVYWSLFLICLIMDMVFLYILEMDRANDGYYYTLGDDDDE